MGIVSRAPIFDGLVEDSASERDIADSAIVAIERAFKRADITIEGKPLQAKAPIGFSEGDAEFIIRDAHRRANPNHLGLQRDYLTYAWVERQFARGALNMKAADPNGDPDGWGSNIIEDTKDREHMRWVEKAFDSKEARLGLDAWREGRKSSVALAEDPVYAPDAFSPEGYSDVAMIARRRIIESVRDRLNWPKFDYVSYNPPPPAEWRLSRED